MRDIDGLIEKVRSISSRVYFSEAVNAYRVGANRACIISLWVTVIFDIIEKLRELSKKDDKNASSYIENLDKAIINNDIASLKNIEGGLLEKSYQDFGFFTKQEYDLLSRLRDDRNLCAHPALTTSEKLFEPSSELVRSHIIHVGSFLLTQKPIQGKAAIKAIFNDIISKSFPENLDRTYEFLKEKYFKRAKDALIRNLIRALAKIIIQQNEPDLVGKEEKMINTLIVTSRTHPKIYEEEIKQFLSQIIEGVKDNDLLNILWLLEADEKGWQWLDESAKIRIKSLLEKKLEITPSALEVYHLLEKLQIGELNDVRKKVLEEIDEIIYKNIFEYKQTSNYRKAEEVGEDKILPYINFFNKDHVAKLVYAFIHNKNEQIIDASGSPDIWNQIFDNINRNVKKCSIKNWIELKEFVIKKKRRKSYETLIKKISELEFIIES